MLISRLTFHFLHIIDFVEAFKAGDTTRLQRVNQTRQSAAYPIYSCPIRHLSAITVSKDTGLFIIDIADGLSVWSARYRLHSARVRCRAVGTPVTFANQHLCSCRLELPCLFSLLKKVIGVSGKLQRSCQRYAFTRSAMRMLSLTNHLLSSVFLAGFPVNIYREKGRHSLLWS